MRVRKSCKSRDGFSLVLVLIVLLLGMVFVTVSFHIVEWYSYTSFKQTSRLDAYNLGVSGIEDMKFRLEKQLNEGRLPVSISSEGGWITSSDLVDSDGDGFLFDGLIAYVESPRWVGSIKETRKDGMELHVFLYDLDYKLNEDINYLKNMPPQYTQSIQYKMDGDSEKEVNYDGDGDKKKSVKHYMIRSIVKDRYDQLYFIDQVLWRVL